MTRKLVSTALLSGVLLNVGLIALNLLAPPAYAAPASSLTCLPPNTWRHCQAKCTDGSDGCCAQVCTAGCNGCEVPVGG